MNAFAATLSLAPGLALGSFLNVVAARVPLRRSVVAPASACMSCGEPIAWQDNVPIASWLLLRGRCRHCGDAIPWVYPAVELATAALVAGCVLAFGVTLEGLLASFFCAVLVVVSATDLKHRIIPNRVAYPAAVVILGGQTALHPSPEWALGALGASAFLFAALVAYPAGMGMGDVKLAFVFGAMLGRSAGVALMLGMLLALVPSIVLLGRHGLKARKMKIPFGPFLALGAAIALFWGDWLLDGYLRLL